MSGQLQKMMKQAKKMQAAMNKMQEDLESSEFEAEAGGGMVKVTMNGKHVVQAIKIQKEVVDPEDVEALEDLLLVALNQATAKVDEKAQDSMGGITGGMQLSGM